MSARSARGLSRRALLGGAGAALCGAPLAARVSPATMTSLVEPGYQPAERDEVGLWRSLERLEEDLAASNILFEAPALHAYSLGIMRNLLGAQMRDFRLYLVHDPAMNAAVLPNGLVFVNSGLLVRMRSEAQYAAVLGHESGHYLRKHTLARIRDRKAKSAVMAFVTAGASVSAGAVYLGGGPYAGASSRSIVDMANSINAGLALSLFSFSRENEMEADAFGVKLMERAGYPPAAASDIWAQVIEEQRSSAASLGKRYRDRTLAATSTHPATESRMVDLAASAREIAAPGRVYDDRRTAWTAAIAPFRGALLAEQIALNDAGASLYVIEGLAQDGWDGTLHYWRGEALRLRDLPGDAAQAGASYAAAVACADAPAEAWRAHGYHLLKTGDVAGRVALRRYLALKPDAADAAMVRFALAR